MSADVAMKVMRIHAFSYEAPAEGQKRGQRLQVRLWGRSGSRDKLGLADFSWTSAKKPFSLEAHRSFDELVGAEFSSADSVQEYFREKRNGALEVKALDAALHNLARELGITVSGASGAEISDISPAPYVELIPVIGDALWFPAVEPTEAERRQNTYRTRHLRELAKPQLDSSLLEREALRFGLGTLRTPWLSFEARDRYGRVLGFSWTRSSASSQIATAVTTDKHSTRMVLDNAGIPVPRGRRFSAHDVAGAVKYAEGIGYPVVFKPLRGTGGRGVVTDINDAEGLEWAFHALKDTDYANRDVIVEEHIHGTSGRAYVVGGRVVSMIHWPNGTVQGNGSLTVEELLLRKHQVRDRNPHLMNRPIQFDKKTEYKLEQQGVDYQTVLPAGKSVTFSMNPNPQQGGETLDVLKELHSSFEEASVAAVRAIPGLRYGAVDWIIPDHRKPLSGQRAAICEINAHPSHSGNQFPLYGQSSDVSREIVRLVADNSGVELETQPREKLSLRLVIRGRVSEEVGYPSWFASHARQWGLTGWVRLKDDRTVEALISGPTEEAAALVTLAISGPQRALVESVRTAHAPEDVHEGFEVTV